MELGLQPPPQRPTFPFLSLFFPPKYKRWRVGIGGRQAVGITIFTRRHWLPCLSSETCNFIVSRAQTCQENTFLMASSFCFLLVVPQCLMDESFLPTHPGGPFFQSHAPTKWGIEASGARVRSTRPTKQAEGRSWTLSPRAQDRVWFCIAPPQPVHRPTSRRDSRIAHSRNGQKVDRTAPSMVSRLPSPLSSPVVLCSHL